jgi:hypothetical protein
MLTTPPNLVSPNPYSSPIADEEAAVSAARANHWPAEIWVTSVLVALFSVSLGLASLYVLLSALATEQDALATYFPLRFKLAPFAVGAANALVIAGFIGFAQFRAVVSGEPIWAGTMAMVLAIAAVLIAFGGFVLSGVSTAALFFVLPAVGAFYLSRCMFNWRITLHHRRRGRRLPAGSAYFHSALGDRR